MSYIHDVPNHLEIEDTFLLGLTVRQCIMLGVGAAMAYALFEDIVTALPDSGADIVVGLIAACLLFGVIMALALVKVGERGLDEWGLVWLTYHVRPRIYLWRFNRPDAFEKLDQVNLEGVSDPERDQEAAEEW